MNNKEALSPEKIADQLLTTLSLLVIRAAREKEADCDLTGSQRSLLSRLINYGPQTMGALALAERVKPPTMTRLVQRLEQKGYIVRRPDPADRRNRQVDYTSKAWSAMENSRGAQSKALALRISQYSKKDQSKMRAYLKLIQSLIAKK